MLSKLGKLTKLVVFLRRINTAILVLLILNIVIFVLILYWLKNTLANSLVRYTTDFYIAISKNISSRIKRYIE